MRVGTGVAHGYIVEVTTGGATVTVVVSVFVVVVILDGVGVGISKHEHALEMADGA